MRKYIINSNYREYADIVVATAEEIVDSLNDGKHPDAADAIFEVATKRMATCQDRWGLLMAYQTPQEADYNKAWHMFLDDLFSIIDVQEIETKRDTEERDEDER